MRMYTLLLKRSHDQAPEHFEFHAEDPTDAFSIAKRRGGDKPVELWEGTKRLGRLTRVQDDLWQID